MTNIVLLGSGGFIGKRLMKFAQNENPIIGLDLPEFDILNFDVTSFVEEYLDADKNNLIINCIGLMGAGASKRDPERFLNVNGIYVQKLIDACKLAGNTKLLQISTETVYGQNQDLNSSPDEHSAIAPQHNYSISKYIAETLIQLSSIRHLTLRVPVVVGPLQVEQNIFSDVIQSIEKQKEAVIFGDGSHSRKYISVSSLVSLITRLSGDEYWEANGVFNVPGSVHSVNQVCSMALEIGLELKTKFDLDRKAFSLFSDHSKFVSVFGSIYEHENAQQLLMEVKEQ